MSTSSKGIRKLRVEGSSATYEAEQYVTDLANIRQTLDKYGVAVLPGLLDEGEIQRMNSGMWDTLEEMTSEFRGSQPPIDRNRKQTWSSIAALKPSHGFMIRNWGVGQAKYCWDVRANRKVCEAFAAVHETAPEDLITSFDAVSMLLPDGQISSRTSPELWLHTDQRFNYDQEPYSYSVQAWVTGYDVNPGYATLALLEGSHKYHASLAERFGVSAHRSNWWQMQREEEYKYLTEECKCPLKAVSCPAGSMVLFDSRLFHSGMSPPSGSQPLPRHVVYVCMTPRAWCSEGDLCRRRDLYFNGRMTGHVPHIPRAADAQPRAGGGSSVRVKPPPMYAAAEMSDRMRMLVPME